jgi:repressor LexA
MKAVEEYILQHRYAPTVREIGEMTGLRSTSTIHHHLKKLFNDGKLETDAEYGTPRAIRLPGYHLERDT